MHSEAHLHTVQAVCSDFEHFLEVFLESAPVLHMLHDELTEVLRELMLHFVKEGLVKGKSAHALVELTLGPKSCLAADKFDVGSHEKAILRNYQWLDNTVISEDGVYYRGTSLTNFMYIFAMCHIVFEICHIHF